MDEWHDADERSSVEFSDKSGTQVHGLDVGYTSFAFTSLCIYTFVYFFVKTKHFIYSIVKDRELNTTTLLIPLEDT